MMVETSSSVCNLGALDSLSEASISEILESWNTFCLITETIVKGDDDANLSTFYSNFQLNVSVLCNYGLRSLLEDHFLLSLQEMLEKHSAPKFWKNFDAYSSNVAVLDTNDTHMQEDEVELILCKALEEISLEKQYQEKCLLMLVNSLQLCQDNNNTSVKGNSLDIEKVLLSKYRLVVTSVLMTTLPQQFTEVLHRYFKGRLEELSTIMAGDYDDNNETQNENDMVVDGSYDQKKFLENKLVRNIGMVVHNLRNLGFTSMTEDAYASAIFLLLKAKVYDLAGDDYRSSVLESIKGWIQVDLYFPCLYNPTGDKWVKMGSGLNVSLFFVFFFGKAENFIKQKQNQGAPRQSNTTKTTNKNRITYGCIKNKPRSTINPFDPFEIKHNVNRRIHK